MQRLPGPQCSAGLGPDWIDHGTLSRARATAPSALGASELTPEERERILDLTQIVLDLAGFVDPTPVSDGGSAAISVSRGDWFGAGLSGLALIPYVGDLAKVGKLGRWVQAVQKSVALARRNARFAERVRPVMRQLSNVLEQIPAGILPESARAAVIRLKADLASVLGVPKRFARTWLVDRYLQRWYRYIDDLELPAPARDQGVLWTKLADVQPGTEGAHLAERLAVLENKVTLETTLKSSKFAEKYRLAAAQLSDQLGIKAGELWEEFGKKVWTRISLRYAHTLQGRVSAYVRLGGEKGLQKAVSAGSEPVFIDEMWAISELIQANAAITSVELVDVVSGARKLMMRDDVLRATRVAH